MVDRDATFTYSKVRGLSFNGLGIAVFPNPVYDKIYFTELELSKIGSVEIVNSDGKVILTPAKVIVSEISVANPAVGMYYVAIQKPGGTTQTNKIFVLR